MRPTSGTKGYQKNLTKYNLLLSVLPFNCWRDAYNLGSEMTKRGEKL